MLDDQIPWGPTGQLVYDRTYSRTKPDGSKESWPDTVQRVVDGNLSLVDARHQLPGEREDLIRLMTEFKILPAGRHLWATGVKNGQHLMNCWVSGWTDKPSDHFAFTFTRLMEGGGVGANYSNKYLAHYPPVQQELSVHIVCSEDHADYQLLAEHGLLSADYDADWAGAFEVEDSREGWAAALTDLIDTHYREDVEHRSRVYDVSNVREAGRRIKTFGGKASGPEPLARMLHDVSDVLSTCAGLDKRLDGLSAMKIDHAIARCVVAGGVRRSARMAMMHWNDPQVGEFIRCKSDAGDHWTTNISVEVDDEFWEWVGEDDNHWCSTKALAWSVLEQLAEGAVRNGEPGMWDSSLSNAGEPNEVVCTNPCLTADSLLFTSVGLRSFGDLLKSGETTKILTDNRVSYQDDGGPESAKKWVISPGEGGTFRPASEVFLTQKDAPTVVVDTREGFQLKLTPDHLVATPEGMVAAGDLKHGSQVLVTKGFAGMSVVGEVPETFEEAEMLLMGLLTGDGTFSKGKSTEVAHICLWSENFHRESEITCLIQSLFDNFEYKSGGSRPYSAFYVSRTDKKITISSSFLARHLKEKYGFSRESKHEVPSEVLAKSRFAGLWYLAGLFFCDGTVNVGKSRDSVRLNQSNYELLQQVQLMLLSNGIYSRIYKRRNEAIRLMPDGKGGLKEYTTKATYEIVSYGDRSVFGKVVGFWGSAKDEKLAGISTDSYHKDPLATVVSVTPGKAQDVYCLREPVTRSMVVNGVAMRRCGEITLEPWEPCNLGHVNMAAFANTEAAGGNPDIAGMIRAHRLMTRFLIRATFAEVGDPKSRQVLDRNRRIGVGHLGVASFLAMSGVRYSDAPATPWFRNLLRDMAKYVDEEAEQFAHQLRIPVPVKKRTVAPTGTVAKMPGVSEGIHPIFSQYFSRRIRFNKLSDADSLLELVDQGYHVEDDLFAPNTAVVTIPTQDSLVQQVSDLWGENGEDLVESAADLTLNQMLAFQAMYQMCWADNAVSFTANVDPEKYTSEDVATQLKKFGGLLKGSTIFPEKSFPQAPYERLSKAEYLSTDVRAVSDGVDEECGTGGCPIK